MAFIDAKEVKLQSLLSNSQEAYKVPSYQRPYTWNKDQWEDLFEDIQELKDDQIHFLGAIVVVPEGQHRLGLNYFNIVDGQQRIATLLIWLSAIRDIALEKGNEQLAYDLENFLFVKEIGKVERLPKLELGKVDAEAFISVLKRGTKEDKHLIFECYKYLKKNTKDENLWQKLLKNISVVHINALSYFNAFRLFETLNDRGLELSAVDLIKNFVLMKVSYDSDTLQKTIDEWAEMYEKVKDHDPVKFVRRYILSNFKGKVSEERLYEKVSSEFKEKRVEDIYEFVKNLNSSATIYKSILECSLPYDKLNKKLNDLHLIEVTPSITLLLKLIPHLERNEISDQNINDIMEMIEIFHIRWGICGQSTSRLDQIYNELCLELNNPIEFEKLIKQKFSQEIKNNVDNEIFKRNFISRNFKATEKRTKYILWKLSRPTGETLLNINEIQTEHIMPKTLSEDWINYLRNITGKSKEEILALHKDNLDKIGNLTIIKGNWNDAMSNKLFNKKINDYSKSEFKINKILADNYCKWTFDDIENRTKEIVEEALKIWQWKW
jgi:uncharacterized protein with ParB-like and HNH nuclease domain